MNWELCAAALDSDPNHLHVRDVVTEISCKGARLASHIYIYIYRERVGHYRLLGFRG